MKRVRGMLVQELKAGDPELIGPYRVIRRLGMGGMGQVFLGRSPGGRLLAIKVIRAGLAADPQFRARFRREVAAARSVSGVFTASVVDADTEAPVPWLATAYIAGSSLADAVARYGPWAAGPVLALAAGSASASSAVPSAELPMIRNGKRDMRGPRGLSAAALAAGWSVISSLIGKQDVLP